jgi:RNA polymerase sigma-70 factor, ECF subfamily
MIDLETIIRVHSDVLWSAAYRLLDNRDDALECVQETFLAALELSRTDEVRHWRTLLLRIVTFKSVDRLRLRYRRSETLASFDRLRTLAAADGTPDARVQNAELLEQVRRALAQLPPQQAGAFWLRHVEHLSVIEIAEEMQITPAHLRVLVHRAAIGLRALLGATYGPSPISEQSP